VLQISLNNSPGAQQDWVGFELSYIIGIHTRVKSNMKKLRRQKWTKMIF